MKNYQILRSFYFFYFALIGVLIPFYPIYLKNLGFSPKEIGFVFAAWPVAKFIFPLLWSPVADRLGKRKIFITLAAWGCFFSSLGFLWAETFAGCLAQMFFFSFFRMPLLPMVEATALESCQEGGWEYGTIRYLGSIGFIVGSFLFGWLLDFFPTSIILWGMIFLMFAQAIFGSLLPQMATAQPLTQGFKGIRTFFRREVFSFLAAGWLRTFSFGAFEIFFSVWVISLGHSSSMVGILWTTMVLAEIFAMIVMPELVNRFTLRQLMGMSLALTVVRWLILAMTHWLPALFFAQTLHFFSFGVFHLAATAYIYAHSPPLLRSTGQSLYTSISFGLGSALGFFVMGALGESFPQEKLFLMSAGIATAGLFFIPGFSRSRSMGEILKGRGNQI